MPKLKIVNNKNYPYAASMLEKAYQNLDALLEWSSSRGFLASSKLLINKGANIKIAHKYGTTKIQNWLKEQNK